ncbi:expressed unknown protein [Seminavis robusta]|uniref:PARP catalytic domain-containing protein n=1 Tax=Seminavis robusta TaxID=568900 RepID=A0A9N8EV25_9STRA|nr:expressed unknown protein [Seminavis robusta]|eukprot:Sro1701_g292170.1 n/a (468) ;mRNA; f:8367-9770
MRTPTPLNTTGIVGSQQQSLDKDRQVSLVLDHFQAQPAFLRSESPTARRLNKSPSAAKKRNKQTNGNFSSIHYQDKALSLVYQHYCGYRLEFGIPVNITSPYKIHFVPDKYYKEKCEWMDHEMIELCQRVNAEECASLFSTVSKLLLELGKLTVPPPPQQPFLPNNDRKHEIRRLWAHKRTAWDLPLFLMRCAATSQKSSRLCTPFPLGYERHPAFVLHHNNIRDTALQQPQRTCDEASLVSFLSSRQWTEKVKLAVDDNVSTKTNTKAIQVTLDLRHDPTPHFQQLVHQRGSVKAFHGTSIENAWSILNFGLCTHPAIQKNGALMGPAVYLSDKYDVAYFFATQNGSAKYLPRAIWRAAPSFWNLLSSLSPSLVQYLQDPHAAVDLTCYAVVECTIVQPPKKHDDDPHFNGTKRRDHYFAVPNPQDIHMEQMHLILEFTKRPTLSPWMAALMVLVVVLVWKLPVFS